MSYNCTCFLVYLGNYPFLVGSTAISDTVVRQMLRDMCKNDAYSTLVVKMDQDEIGGEPPPSVKELQERITTLHSSLGETAKGRSELAALSLEQDYGVDLACAGLGRGGRGGRPGRGGRGTGGRFIPKCDVCPGGPLHSYANCPTMKPILEALRVKVRGGAIPSLSQPGGTVHRAAVAEAEDTEQETLDAEYEQEEYQADTQDPQPLDNIAGAVVGPHSLDEDDFDIAAVCMQLPDADKSNQVHKASSLSAVLLLIPIFILGILLMGLSGYILSYTYKAAQQALSKNALSTHSEYGSVAVTPPPSTVSWMVDSGCSSHMTPHAGIFESWDYSLPNITYWTAASTVASIQGGTVKFRLSDMANRQLNMKLYPVYYVPEAHFSLMAVRRMISANWKSPDFELLRWNTRTGHTLRIKDAGNAYLLDTHTQLDSQAPTLSVIGPTQGIANSAISSTTDNDEVNHGFNMLDTSDWQTLRTECKALASLYAPKGNWDLDLFTDGLGPVKGNSQAARFYSVKDSAWQHTWSGMAIWGCPVFTPDSISATLSKALKDFNTDPDNTVIMLLVPRVTSATWWHLTKYFEPVQVFDKGTKLFTRPARSDKERQSMEPAGDEGGPDRVFADGTPFTTVALLKTKHTKVQIDNHTTLHLRLGHYGYNYIAKLLDMGVDLGVKPNMSVLKSTTGPISCGICQLCKMQRPGPYHETIQDYDSAEPLSIVASDIKGPLSPESAKGYQYIICFVCVKTRYSWIQFMPRKSDAVFALKEFLDWAKKHAITPKKLLLKTDCGSEYTGGAVAELCRDKGIKQITSCPDMHEGNAYAESLWRVLSNIFRAIMNSADLPMQYWPLGFRHANYIRI